MNKMMMEHNKRTFKKECFGLQRSERVMTEQIQKEYDDAKSHYETAKYLDELSGEGITVITYYVGKNSTGKEEDRIKDLEMNLENKKLSLRYSKNKTFIYHRYQIFRISIIRSTKDGI